MKSTVYTVLAITVYVIIFVILMLALIFGTRALANVKRQKISSLARGFSPLDVQRIFIGKTYPRKLTRALIVHWAQMGYIEVRHVSKCKVSIIKVKSPPAHDDEKAIFFDRGTYVRERDLFSLVFKKENAKIVNIFRPLFSRYDVKTINEKYAVREDEGVYSSRHYKLKVLTFTLSIAPFFISAINACIYLGNIGPMVAPLAMCLGMFVARFMKEIPFLFRVLWGSVWVVLGIIMLVNFYGEETVFDPLYMCYASVAILFLGQFVLIQFVDYRERNNLADYSDLVNFRRFLLFSGKEKLKEINYFEALPYIYALGIKFLVKHKFTRTKLPDWYLTKDGERGWLL